MRIRAAALLLIALSSAGCDKRRRAGQVVVSAIGSDLRVADPSRGALRFTARLMLDATAQGLVRFDAAGQVEPGIAERWIVIDDGLRYIFRLRDAEWSDGRPVTAAQVVAVLRRQLAVGSRNPLTPFLTAIDEVVEMTPEVIEVRLNRPRPDLLKLFAQPELAVFRTRPPNGSGPLRVMTMARDRATLRATIDPSRSPDEVDPPEPEDDILVIGERAAKAVARFAGGRSDLVGGGTFDEWPLLSQAVVAPANRRIDPAAGLFGLVVADRDGFLADGRHRAAVAAALDRATALAAFLPEWTPVTQLLPEQLDSAVPPFQPGWVAIPPAERVPTALRLVQAWRATHPGALRLRLALPLGPGGTLLYGMLGASLKRIGIVPVRVGLRDAADLRLIDAVAPYDSARWYLATACAPCGTAATAAIDAAREAPTITLRAQRIAEADAALAADGGYIPIARPLRWSLVALRLDRWQGNARAWHPLNRLRGDTN